MRALVSVAVVAALVGCGSSELDAPAEAVPLSSAAARPLARAADWKRLPAAERARQIAATQAAAGPEYAVAAHGSRLEAKHRSMLFETSFERSRVLVGPNQEASERVDLAVAAVGCSGELIATASVRPSADPARPNRVEYAHVGGFSEWYVHGPAGLEQGFTLRELPECARRGDKLVIQLAETPGWHTQVSKNGARAILRGSSGEELHYGELYAEDARGTAVPVRLAARGAPTIELDTRGAALPIVVDPLVWSEQQKVTASDGADTFGRSVSLNGDTALIGATGAAYVFVRSGNTWVEQSKLTAGDGLAGDLFGRSVSLHGDTAVVGAPANMPSAFVGEEDTDDIGAAYIYVRSGTSWVEQAKLTGRSSFGHAVSLDGDTVLIGNQGSYATYIFVRTGTSWSEQAKFSYYDPDSASPDLSPRLGQSVSLSGDTALVSSYLYDGAFEDPYVFVRSGTSWTQQARLDAPGNEFGSAVSLSGDTALFSVYGPFGVPSVRIFARIGTTWSEEAPIQHASANFGYSLSLSGDHALVGSDSRAYAFARSGTSWLEQSRLTPSDTVSDSKFGTAVSLSGQTALVGDQGADSAYFFGEVSSDGDACTADDDCESKHCVEGVCCNDACTAGCQSCLASLKGSGVDGECGPVLIDTDPKDACAVEPATSCGETGACDGSGECSLHSAGTECAAASCPTPTSASVADSCDGDGACVVTDAIACALGYACVAGACQTSCGTNADCDTALGFECFDAVCKLPTGAACDDASECGSGYCADGVCCDAECSGACVACIATLTGGNDGTCAPIPADQDPRDQCEPSSSFPNDCQQDGFCDGEGQCREHAKLGTPCGEATCSDGAVHGPLCNGSGQCTPCDEESPAPRAEPARCIDDDTKFRKSSGDVVDCAPFVCDPDSDACLTACSEDADCAARFACIYAECVSTVVHDDCAVVSPGASSPSPRLHLLLALAGIIALGTRRRNELSRRRARAA